VEFWALSSDILHPGRANVAKDELRGKLAELYKANKEQVSVFGLRTHYGGGKTTGFALIYDSAEALKKFEPHYRLVRIGVAAKIEKASRQQRMSFVSSALLDIEFFLVCVQGTDHGFLSAYRQTTEKPIQEVQRNGEDQGRKEGQEEINCWLAKGWALLLFVLSERLHHDWSLFSAMHVRQRSL
jgi:ribosomal protein S24E